MTSKLSLLILLSVVTFISCKKEENEVTPSPPELIEEIVTNSGVIDPELAPFIDAFRAEGKKRGLTFTTNLEAFIVEDYSIPSYRNLEGLAGIGSSDWNGKARIEIKKSGWMEYTDLEKENLVYHELGHALLSRPHLSTQLADGHTPKSIMCGERCFGGLIIFYKDGPLRTYYLDELFDQRTPVPDFIEKNQLFSTAFQDNFQDGIDNWQIQNLTPDIDSISYDVFIDSSEVDSSNQVIILEKKEPSLRTTELVFSQNVNLLDLQEEVNIVAAANVSIEGFADGQIELNLLIIGKNEQNQDETYFDYSDVVERDFIKSDMDKKFRIKGFCIPKESAYFVVSIFINSKNAGRVVLKEVKVELFK